MLSDPIADMISQIRNAYMAGKQEVSMPWSTIKEKIAKVLEKEGYLGLVKKQKTNNYPVLVCQLIYKNSKPAITKIEKVSRPGLRIYARTKKLPRVLSGLGMSIISTSHGIITGKEARKKKIGGEIICKVW